MARFSKLRIELVVTTFAVVAILTLLTCFTVIQVSPEMRFMQQFAEALRSQVTPSSDIPEPISSFGSSLSDKSNGGTALSGQPLHSTSRGVNDSTQQNDKAVANLTSPNNITAAISVGTDHSLYAEGANARIDGSFGLMPL